MKALKVLNEVLDYAKLWGVDPLAKEEQDLIDDVSEAIKELEALKAPKTCEWCKHFMSNHSFRLGHSDYLNGCRVLITPSDFSCSDFEPKEEARP